MYKKIKKLSFNALENEKSKLFWIINDFLSVLIVLSVISIILESIESINQRFETFFIINEWIVVAIFTLEYFMHIFNAKKKLKYIFSFYGIVDLLAIIPTYLLLFDLRALKIFRSVRLLRSLRLLRILKLVNSSKQRYKRQKKEREIIRLNITIYFATMSILIILIGTILYYIEKDVPGTMIHNIPEGIWLAISTVSTVAFGDVYPITVAGKLVTSVAMISGLALLGLMVTIVGRTMTKLLFGDEPKNGTKDKTLENMK